MFASSHFVRNTKLPSKERRERRELARYEKFWSIEAVGLQWPKFKRR